MKKSIKKARARLNILWPMIISWVVVLVVCVVVYIFGDENPGSSLGMPNFRLLTIILTFATFVMTSLFSFLILSHNVEMRKMSQNQFVSNNYSVIEFFGDMLLYEQYANYTEKLKKDKDFALYLRDETIDMNDVEENFDNYAFLNIRIPLRVIEGKGVAGVRITRFRFSREGHDFRFLQCGAGANTLIIYDEATKCRVILASLIIKKDDDFFVSDEVNPFGKIKLNLSMHSVLGVEVEGWTELYFTNPRKAEKDGANVYKITSSQFKISGLPTLAKEVKSEV